MNRRTETFPESLIQYFDDNIIHSCNNNPVRARVKALTVQIMNVWLLHSNECSFVIYDTNSARFMLMPIASSWSIKLCPEPAQIGDN